jgi:hypothetical protein
MPGRTRSIDRFSLAAAGSLNDSAGALVMPIRSACVVRSAIVPSR